MQCGLEEKYKAKRLCDLNFMETKLSGKNERQTHKTPKMIVLFLIKKKIRLGGSLSLVQEKIFPWSMRRVGMFPVHIMPFGPRQTGRLQVHKNAMTGKDSLPSLLS